MKHVKNIRIGDVLKESGYATEEQIEAALNYQRDHRELRLGDALIELGYVTERQVLEALGKRLELSVIDVSEIKIDVNAVMKIPEKVAEENMVFAIDMTGGMLNIVTSDPTNFYGIEYIRQLTGMDLIVNLCEKSKIQDAIRYYYSEVDAMKAATKASVDVEETIRQIDVDDVDDDTPVINLIDSLIKRAYNVGASDIHIEPFESHTQIRMRVDGIISNFVTIEKNIHAAVIARIKIMGDMDIAERNLPQDGHVRFNVDGTWINLRISLIPTVFGEKAVMRLLASNTAVDNMQTFGMTDENYRKFSEMLRCPNGIIYVTGPTGSGKSTTLYMILEAISGQKINISTIEDPVEKNISNINQMQVNNQAGVTFEAGLRALLRQDPDVIMIGETRDNETASISVRAAITGHVVFSTLHTNDSVSSITRLVDMGVERFLLASSLTGIVAQRLVRKVCPYCAEERELSEAEKEFTEGKITTARYAKGCNMCNFSGYSGRTAIHEVFVIDKEVRKMITNSATMDEIRNYATTQQNMKLLKDSGIELIKDGTTTVEEIMRVAYYL